MLDFRIISQVLIAMAVTFLAPLAMAQADCSEEIAVIDERIAAGNFPQQNVQIARQLQDSLQQMCAFLDDATKAAFMEQFEDLLPTKPKEERQAERRARADERKAIRNARKRAEAARTPAPQNAVLQALPTAKTLGGHFVERPDPMYHLWIWDWDTFNGKLRILYLSHPDRTQFGLPDWKSYVYVVEISTDGTSVQHMVTSKQEIFNFGGLALRRGHDEILFHRRNSKFGDIGTLERWSISDRRLLSSVPAPNPKWPDGTGWDWGPFRLATSDGNVLYSQTKAEQRGNRGVTAWFESSPDGRVIGQGSMADARQGSGVSSWFSSNNGGGGLVLTVSNTEEAGIKSVVETPIKYEIGGRKVNAVVSREKRLLVTNDNAASTWESAAIERDMMWGGDLAIPDDLPAQEMLSQSNEYLELTRTVDNARDANRSVSYLNVGPHSLEMIKPMKNGYGILVAVTANQDLAPPIHGPHFLKVDSAGVHKIAYLEPYATQLSVKFTMLGISKNDDVYLYGFPTGRNDGAYVVLLNADGEPEAYGQTAQGRTIVMEGTVGDSSGAWVFGHAYRGKDVAKLWVERIEFP